MMICRLWRGWTTKDNADAYERIVRGQVIPGIEGRGIAGVRSIDLVRRERDYDVEFMTLMWFVTLGSVKEFMGEDYETAHVPAQARAVLTDFDRRSAHYEVSIAASSLASSARWPSCRATTRHTSETSPSFRFDRRHHLRQAMSA